jgi:hypothetical protein
LRISQPLANDQRPVRRYAVGPIALAAGAGAAGHRIGIAVQTSRRRDGNPAISHWRREQAADPCRRGAAFRKLDVQFDQHVEIMLVAAEHRRLDDVEIANVAQGNDVFRNAAGLSVVGRAP